MENSVLTIITKPN